MSSQPFSRIAIFGPGLLGGSLALAIRQRLPGVEIALWGRRQEVLEQARGLCMADVLSTDVKTAGRGADLLVFCTPIGAMPALARELAALPWPSRTIFTDVGSVKASVVRELTPLLNGCGAGFLGSHPIAGSEKTGLAAAQGDLFDNARCILTPLPGSEEEPWARLEQFWQTLRMRTLRVSPEEHDEIVARISHLPHITAAALVLAALRDAPEYAPACAGPGFRDTTRVAAGAPEMWTEILLENRAAVLSALSELHSRTGDLLSKLEAADATGIHAFLAQAQALRQTVYPQAPSDAGGISDPSSSSI